MNSFYGGKKGAPFVIVNSYKTVAEMANDFSSGLQNTTVQFDEYVIINTVNKNDPDNGRIYRRGYDLSATEEDPKSTVSPKEQRLTGGGIYIGTVVGPAGHAPRFNLTTMEVVEQQKNEWDEQTWEVRKGSGTYAPTENLIPGYNGPNATGVDFSFDSAQFTDDIKWNYISIRDENKSDTDVYIGFKIPYTVFNYTASSVTPYYNRSNQTDNFINESLIDRQPISNNHPFYEYWDIKIPKGIKGDAFKNFRVIEANNNDNIQEYNGQESDKQGQNNDGRDSSARKILVYDYYHYDQEENGQPVSLYLGDYNMIKSIYLDDDGTFEVNYTHNDADKWINKINWINSVTLDSNTGDFKIIYNNNSIEGDNLTEQNGVSEYNIRLKWVDGVFVNDNGSITLRYTTLDDEGNQELKVVDEVDKTYTDDDGNTVTGKGGPIKWITNIELDEGGTFRINYNNVTEPTIITKALKTITGFDIDEHGTIKVSYNNIENDIHGYFQPDIFDNKIQWIDDVNVDDDGTFTVVYNTISEENELNKQQFNKKIKWVKDIKINDKDSENQKVSVQYNNEDSNIWHDIGSSINYIKETAVREEDSMLLVLYSDPEKQGTILYNEKSGWVELGYVRDYSGFQFATVINDLSIKTTEQALNYLNSVYQTGLTGAGATKAVVIFYSNSYNYFGYDYVAEEWKFIGTLYNEIPTNLVASEPSLTLTEEQYNAAVQELTAGLAVGGIWFVEENE